MRPLKIAAVLLGLRLISCAACAARDDSNERLDYVMKRLKSESPGSGIIEGEWYLVSLSMAGLAASRLGRADDLSWLTSRARQSDVRAFDTRMWKSDALATLSTREGHVGYLGHYGLLLALSCAPDRHAVLDALERRYAEGPLIDTYPGQKWVPDNAVALAAVAVGARCDGRQWRGPLDDWPVDSQGLLMFTPRVQPRGSGAGWNSIYLPLVDAAFAERQYALAEQRFGFHLPGLAAWREGIAHGDNDSGPLIFGLSPSGTGFAIAGASERGSLLRTAEAAGVTVPWGGPHYLLAPLVGEAAVLAAKLR